MYIYVYVYMQYEAALSDVTLMIYIVPTLRIYSTNITHDIYAFLAVPTDAGDGVVSERVWYSCLFVCICLHSYIYLYTHIRTLIHTYIHTHMHTHIHTYIHTYIHMNTHAYIFI